MEEQQRRNYVSVTFRCEPCVRSLGRRAPALAVLGRRNGRWAIFPIDRRGILAAVRAGQSMDPLSAKAASSLGTARHALRDGGPLPDPKTLGRVGMWVHAPDGGRGKGIELACRCCRRRVRRKHAWYYREAERALAEGRADVFV
jgi:hypothetical protein